MEKHYFILQPSERIVDGIFLKKYNLIHTFSIFNKNR